jgi:hypothetical protein
VRAHWPGWPSPGLADPTRDNSGDNKETLERPERVAVRHFVWSRSRRRQTDQLGLRPDVAQLPDREAQGVDGMGVSSQSTTTVKPNNERET